MKERGMFILWESKRDTACQYGAEIRTALIGKKLLW